MRRTLLGLLALLLLAGLFPGSVQSTPANCIKHNFVSAKAEQADTSLVGPNEWNGCHNLNAPGTGALPYGDTGQSDGLNWLAAGSTGLPVVSQGGGTAPIYSVLGVAGGGTSFASFTAGDTLYASGTTTLSKLGIGSNGTCLTVSSGLPAWGGCTSGGAGSPGASFFEFGEFAPPATPSSGNLRIFLTNAGSGIKRLSALDAGGQTQTLSGVLVRGAGNPYKDVNTTAAETSIFSSAPTIKGGTLGTDRSLRVTLVGDILNSTGGAQGAALKVKYGATTVFSVANGTGQFNVANSGTRYAWHAEGIIAAAGATGAQSASFRFGNPGVGLTGVSGVAVQEGNNGGGTGGLIALHNGVAEDSTADKTFDVTITPSTSSGSLSIRVFYVLVELL